MSNGSDEASNESFSDAIVEQFFTLWVDDELALRNGSGDRSFVRKGVVELDPDSTAPKIWLNDEVTLQAEATAARAIEEGELLTTDDITEIKSFWPVNISPNSGWMAYSLIGEAAYVAFDFRYNKERAGNILTLASEYVESAKLNRVRSPRPAVDDLYSAAELTVQAQMLGRVQMTKLHDQRKQWLKNEAKLGNVPAEFTETLQRLHAERRAARYGEGSITLTSDAIGQLATQVMEMIEHAALRVGVTLPLTTPE